MKVAAGHRIILFESRFYLALRRLATTARQTNSDDDGGRACRHAYEINQLTGAAVVVRAFATPAVWTISP